MMTYEKAAKRAEVYNKRSKNTDYTYEVRLYRDDPNDAFVVQIYKGGYAGIAAY